MKPGTHPNSIKALMDNQAPHFDTERARKAQKNSVIARKANKAARESMKMTARDWATYKEEILGTTNLSALDILKVLMIKALDNDDYDTAAELAKNLAEFEKPKLARVEQKVEEIKTDDLSDEELEAKLKEMLNDKDSD